MNKPMVKGQTVYRASANLYLGVAVREYTVYSVGNTRTRVGAEYLETGDWGLFAETADEARAKLRAAMEAEIAEAEAKIAWTRAFIAKHF